MTTLFTIVLIALGLFFIWRVFKFASHSGQLRNREEAGDINVREPVPRRPTGKAGAVATEEPDDDIDSDAYSRR
jgi:hypothetical protein